MKERLLSVAIYGLGSGIGALAFLHPFLAPSIQGQSQADDAPLMLTALVGLCFVVLLLEVQGQIVNAKFVALLGILVSMNAVLRFLEVAIPGPGGFSPIFFLIVLTGYVYGGRFGFLMGALTLLVSALITGAVGPWLPYQMLTAGWVGMSAPLCRPLVKFSRSRFCAPSGRQSAPGTLDWRPARAFRDLLKLAGLRFEVVVLAAFAGLWGLAYGGIINVSFWPYTAGPANQYWEPGIGLGDTLRRYVTFYLATSLAWDIVRAVGNVSLVLALGAPTLDALRRFQRRFAFSYRPAYEASSTPGQAQQIVGER